MKGTNLNNNSPNIIINSFYFLLVILLVLQNQFVACVSRNLKVNIPHRSAQSIKNGHIPRHPTPASSNNNPSAKPDLPTSDPQHSTLADVASGAGLAISTIPSGLQATSTVNKLGNENELKTIDGQQPMPRIKNINPNNQNQKQNKDPANQPAKSPTYPETTPKQPKAKGQQQNQHKKFQLTNKDSQPIKIAQQKISPSSGAGSVVFDQQIREGQIAEGRRIKVQGFRLEQKNKNKVAAVVALNNNYASAPQYYYAPLNYSPYQPVGYIRIPYQYPANPAYGYPQYYYPPNIYQQPTNIYNAYTQQQPQQNSKASQISTTSPAPAPSAPSAPSTNIIITSNTPTTITTTNNPNGSSTTTTTITPAPAPAPTPTPQTTLPSSTLGIQGSSNSDSFNVQVTNNLINNIFTHLIPKNDPNLYNTGPSEKVYQIKNIDLNVTNVNNTGTTTGPTNIVTTVNANGVDAQKLTSTTPNTSTPIIRDTKTGTQTSSSFQPNGGTVLPLIPIIDPSTTSTATTTTTTTATTTATTTTATTATMIDPTTTNATIKNPVVNGTITGTAVRGNTNEMGSQIKFRYEQYLAKYKPNVLTQNPSDLALYRQTIFNMNINTINQHNSNPNKTYEVGVNLFTDLTLDEFNRLFAKLIVPEEVKNQAIAEAAAIQSQGMPVFTVPPSLYADWSCKASPPISQGVCGACYAIAALESISMTKRIRGLSVNFLSIQEVISCGSNNFDLNGCLGGYFSGAYNYAQNFGIGQSSLYYYDDKAKYEGVLSPCDLTFTKNLLYERSRQFIKEGVRIRFGDCAQIVKQLQFRTLTVSIAAYGFQFYTSGVFRTSNKYINHGVTLVGYNPADKSYLIKNSWGATWGNLGYGYIDESTSLCHYAMYPILTPEQENQSIQKCLDVKIPIPTDTRT